MGEPVDPQPLSYATPDADGLPDYVPEAEAMIEQRRSTKKLRPFFRNSDDTARYIAKSLRRRKSLQNVGEVCEMCGGPTQGLYVPVEWQVEVERRTLEFAVSTHIATARTLTHHAVCEACWTSWVKRAGAFRLGFMIYRGLWWVALAAYLWLAGSGNFRRITGGTENASALVFVIFVATFVLNHIAGRLRKLSAPRGIRRVMMPGVSIVQYHELGYRGNTHAS